MGVDLRNFGFRVKKRRRELNYTQAKLAELCGFSVPFIGHIERGSRCPSLESFLVICRALRAAPDYLLQDYLDYTYEDAGKVLITKEDIRSLSRVARILGENVTDYWD